MANDIVAVEGVDASELETLTGGDKKGKFYYPNLSANGAAAKDGIEEQLPIGVYMLSQGSNLLFAKTVLFRPFFDVYNYSEYDSKTKKYVNMSIYVDSVTDEAYDIQGGINCGYVSSKKRESLPEGRRQQLEKIKLYRTWFGLVTLEGAKDVKGNDIEAVEVPCTYRVNGSSFMLLGDEVRNLTKKSLKPYNYNFKFTKPKKHVAGQTVYFTPEIGVVNEQVLVTHTNMDTLRDFRGWVKSENESILKRFRSVKEGISEGDQAEALAADFAEAEAA